MIVQEPPHVFFLYLPLFLSNYMIGAYLDTIGKQESHFECFSALDFKPWSQNLNCVVKSNYAVLIHGSRSGEFNLVPNTPDRQLNLPLQGAPVTLH